MEIEPVITRLQNIIFKNNVLADDTSKSLHGKDFSQDHIRQIKNIFDRKNIMNPGKIISGTMPEKLLALLNDIFTEEFINHAAGENRSL